MIWARTQSMPALHAIASTRELVALAYCSVTFPTYDTTECDENPPHGMRCDCCVGVLVDRRRIEWGLRELVEATA